MTDAPEQPNADPGAAAPRADDATPGGELWARLLAGRVTEVCVLSRRGLSMDLPQTLGLEVIDYEAYRYGSFGVPYVPQERERIARELAAESRWLAVGGPRYWVEPFARRAEVILVMPSMTAELDFALSSAVDMAFSSIGRLLKAALTRRRRGTVQRPDSQRGQLEPIVELATPGREYSGDSPMTDSQATAHYIWMRNFLAGEFPGKTIVLEDGDQVRELRSVRAIPRK